MPEEKPAPGYAVLHIRFGPSGLPSYQTTAATAPFSRILSIPCPKKAVAFATLFYRYLFIPYLLAPCCAQ